MLTFELKTAKNQTHAIKLHKPPTKPIKGMTMVRSGAVTLMVSPTAEKLYGNIATYARLGTRLYSTRDVRRYDWFGDLLKALTRIGALSERQMNYCIAHASKLDEKAEKYYTAYHILRDAAKAGIKLTKAQTAKLNKAIEDGRKL